MGEPAQPTEEDRSATRKLACAIVDSVRNDERMPLPFDDDCGTGRHRMFFADDVESLVMQLAQEITLLVNEKQAFCRAFQVVEVTVKDPE